MTASAIFTAEVPLTRSDRPLGERVTMAVRELLSQVYQARQEQYAALRCLKQVSESIAHELGRGADARPMNYSVDYLAQFNAARRRYEEVRTNCAGIIATLTGDVNAAYAMVDKVVEEVDAK